MNICLLTHSFPPIIGGGETHVYTLAQTFHQQGHHVTVITGQASWITNEILPRELFTVIRLKHMRAFEDGRTSMRQLLPELRAALTTRQFDVIHIHNLMPMLAFAPLATLINSHVLITIHSTPVPEAEKILGHFGDYDLERSFVQFIVRQPFYRKAICPSRYYQEWAIDLGIPKEKTIVIPHGIDSRGFNYQRNEHWRISHGYSPEDFLILCAARMIQRKGLLDLINALELIPNPRVKLYIASSEKTGSQEHTAQVTALIRQRKLKGRVRIALDRHTITDMPHIMANCDAVVLPSHREGFGLVLLEGMAAGRPVIGTRTSGILEVITDGENGLLAEPQNPDDLSEKIRLIVENARLREKLIKGGRLAIRRQFSLQRQIQSLIRAYQE